MRECLDSAINQTMRDIEIICVNDGSTDKSGTILDEYAHKDPRIQVVHNVNQGAAASRNEGIRLAEGEYITFLDADDTFELELCQKLYIHAKSTNSELSLFFSNYDPRHNFQSILFQDIDPSERFGSDKIKAVLEIGCGVCGKFWKTSFLKKNNIIFPANILSGHDQVFAYHGAVLANKVSIFFQKLYNYRYNPNSLSYIGNCKNLITRIEPVFVVLNLLEQLNCDKKTIMYLAQRFFHDFFYIAHSIVPEYQKKFDETLESFILQYNAKTKIQELSWQNDSITRYYEYIISEEECVLKNRPLKESKVLKKTYKAINKFLVEKIIYLPIWPFVQIHKLRKRNRKLQNEINRFRSDMENKIEQWASITEILEKQLFESNNNHFIE